ETGTTLRRSRFAHRSRVSAYAELSNPKPLELVGAQAPLAPDEAMLVNLAGVNESWLWVLRRDGAALHLASSSAQRRSPPRCQPSGSERLDRIATLRKCRFRRRAP